MGLGGVSMTELLIILLIVVLIFGTKRLGTLGADLGSAIKSFRKAMEAKDEDTPAPKPAGALPPQAAAEPQSVAAKVSASSQAPGRPDVEPLGAGPASRDA
ncbi:MAG TPA: twin-arginine translocase TatA/TatE family subunit [Gammaproteobacteria bacterium]